MIFMALTFPAQLQNWMPFDASKPRDLYFPYSSHLSGHKKKARKNSIRLLVKFWNRLWNFKQFKLKSISGKSIWVGTVQHSLTSSDLANVCKKTWKQHRPWCSWWLGWGVVWDHGTHVGLIYWQRWRSGQPCHCTRSRTLLVHQYSAPGQHKQKHPCQQHPSGFKHPLCKSLYISVNICISRLPALSSSPGRHQNWPWSRRYCHPPLPSKLAQMYTHV